MVTHWSQGVQKVGPKFNLDSLIDDFINKNSNTRLKSKSYKVPPQVSLFFRSNKKYYHIETRLVKLKIVKNNVIIILKKFRKMERIPSRLGKHREPEKGLPHSHMFGIREHDNLDRLIEKNIKTKYKNMESNLFSIIPYLSGAGPGVCPKKGCGPRSGKWDGNGECNIVYTQTPCPPNQKCDTSRSSGWVSLMGGGKCVPAALTPSQQQAASTSTVKITPVPLAK